MSNAEREQARDEVARTKGLSHLSRRKAGQ